MNASALAVGLALAWTTAAGAEEAIRTAGPDLPVAGAPAAPIAAPVDQPATDRSAQAIGEWARRVLAGEPTSEEPKAGERPRCAPPADRKPHGEVWAGIGTHGYREIGGVVTQPIGDCGYVSIAISHTEADFGRHARR